jgi:hypothetical protein
MRRTDVLVSLIRLMTENVSVSTTNDIPDDEFIQYLNDAQDRLQSLISNTRETSKLFVTSEIITGVASQEEYSLAGRLFMSKAIEQIEYSSDSTLPNYILLEKLSMFNRDSNTSDWPRGYYRARGKFYPIPILSTSAGSFRVMYEQSLNDVDKRRAQVVSVVGLTTTGFTSMILQGATGTGAPDIVSTPVNFTTVDYVCVVDKDGNMKAKNIPVSSFNSSSYVLTPSAFTFATGETITAGDYVVFNKWTTSHSGLPDDCERYLIHYCAEAIFHRDSSDDFSTQSQLLGRMEEEIIKALKKQTGEIQQIPQLNYDEWY